MRPSDNRPRAHLIDLWLETEETPLAQMWAIDSVGRLWHRSRNEHGAWSEWIQKETPLEPRPQPSE